MRTFITKIRSDFADFNQSAKQPSAQKRQLLGRPAHWLGNLYQLIRRDHATPLRLGVAVAVGFTVGLTPFFGLHLLICLTLAMALRLNKFVVYAAANISVPPMVPIIAILCIQTGHWLTHGQLVTFGTEGVVALKQSFFTDWLLGAAVNGSIIGGILGALVWAAATWHKRSLQTQAANPQQAAIAKIYAAFLPDGRFAAKMIRGKLLHDTVYADVLRQVGELQSLVDIGGGSGLMPMLFAARGGTCPAASVVDWDPVKLARGRSAAARLAVPLAFIHGDVFDAASPAFKDLRPVDCVTCIDVLHYASVPRQRQLVARLAALLKPGGRLIIRDMDADLGWRTRLTLFQERLSLLAKFTRADVLAPRPGRDLMAQLEALGLVVRMQRCYGKTPFSNTLWVAVRQEPEPE